MTARHLTRIDRLLGGLQQAMETMTGVPPAAQRPSPGQGQTETVLKPAQRRDVAGLMRIDHTGEVCAQALYLGQAALARTLTTKTYLKQAAREETDHLAWCAERLQQLNSHPSLLNPLWYMGSYAIGATAAALDDPISLGFIIETEHQVEAHLQEHLQRLPANDHRSAAILKQMQADEARHALNATERGGRELPAPVRQLMRLASGIMKTVAYRI